MNALAFAFAGHELFACGSGALWWPDERLLCVSDLHLGKSERMARRGGALLPPYETEDTLNRLGAEVERLGPRVLVALGDSFDDMGAAEAVADGLAERFLRLLAGRRWIWIAGNHDPAPIGVGGEHLAEARLRGITFRHEAVPVAGPEVSGHYHPKTAVLARGRSISRPAFLVDAERLILPAFGTYTGGLRSTEAVLDGLMGPGASAILTGPQPFRIPMPRFAPPSKDIA